jgi:hypothetical protein
MRRLTGRTYAISFLCLLPLLVGCIAPRMYHVANSTQNLVFSPEDKRYGQGYFFAAKVSEAYVEFDQFGNLDPKHEELRSALEMIHRCRFRMDASAEACPGPKDALSTEAKPIALYIFVHGWKNNASDDTNNPWGYRRFLATASYEQTDRLPVVGIYIGWPGASLKNDKFLSFWNREPVANNVGVSADLQMTLRSLLHEAKGDIGSGAPLEQHEKLGPSAFTSQYPSTAIVIGHSFGGIVLEEAATQLLMETFHQLPREQVTMHCPVEAGGGPDCVRVTPPADLIVLINEAGKAQIGMPFLDFLQKNHVGYFCRESKRDSVQPDLKRCPLLLTMTSEGDWTTKLAYPGGEFLSPTRPKKQTYGQPDGWGQGSSLPYDIVTAGNFIALQSHRIDTTTSECFVTVGVTGKPPSQYCMHAITSLNTTPHWIMQLPQYFVPDHGTVFQPAFLQLLNRAAKRKDFTLLLPAEQARQLQAQ